MQKEAFHYKLPEALIARYPLAERSSSRLLVLDSKTGAIQHTHFKSFSEFLMPGDLCVFNDSRVIPARLFGMKGSGGRVEILIERTLNRENALAHIRASKSPKLGSTIYLENGVPVQIAERDNHGLYQLVFPEAHPVLAVLEQIGHIPLPPYLKREDESSDQERYQTIYAKHPGSVAAPTAGLHFDETILQTLREKKIGVDFVTLHVGAGTFQPVRVSHLSEHHMHTEYFSISEAACEHILATKRSGRRVVAIGTTAARTLESAMSGGVLESHHLTPTQLFIYPGYKFQCVDALFTNFHLPESTLLMLVCAFGGYEHVMRAYQSAVAERYRFFSYGDGMLVL